MATNQVETGQSGLADRLLFEHPRSLGMTWASHGGGAVKIGAELVSAGLACFIHAAIPGWFTQTAGKTVTRIYNHIQALKAGAAHPESWPDYEI